MKTLLQYIRYYMHAGLEKNSEYDAAKDQDDFVDNKINELTNVELLDKIEDWLMDKEQNGWN